MVALHKLVSISELRVLLLREQRNVRRQSNTTFVSISELRVLLLRGEHIRIVRSSSLCFNLRIESLVIESLLCNMRSALYTFVSISELRVLLLRVEMGVTPRQQNISFNLIIENLLIDRRIHVSRIRDQGRFQSHN